MNRIPAARALVCAMLASLAMTPAAGEIFKCQGARGRPVFQDAPCDGSVKRSIAPVARPQAIDPDSALVATDDDRRLLGMLESYQKCTHALPALGYKVAMDYQRWRSEHSTTLARLERDPGFRASIQRAAEEGDATHGKLTQAQAGAMAANCASLEYMFAPVERTLAEIRTAIDRNAATACDDVKRGSDSPQMELIDRKIHSLPVREQQEALKYRAAVLEHCGKADAGQ
ncbi:MAG TPA: DUF4124 domain-containing protein [Usitatibacter sp.]|nr:DUF4124 domain-containing protein [Usitatibacter sp.]